MTDEPAVNLSYYAILYLDILNQKEKLAKILKLPETEEERVQMLGFLKDTYGVVSGINNYFDMYLEAILAVEKPAEIPDNIWNEMRQIGHSEIKKVPFSDSILFYTSMAEDGLRSP